MISMTSSKLKSPASAPDLEILGDQITIHPGGYVEPPSTPQDASPERNLVEHMVRFRESPLDFLREVSLHISGAGWRAYDDIIGQPIFYSGFTEEMKAGVSNSPMLKSRIRELAQRRVDVERDEGLLGEGEKRDRRCQQRRDEIEQSLEEVAADLTDKMICKTESKRFIRGAYYFATQLLTRAYHQGKCLDYVKFIIVLTSFALGIHVSSEEVLRLRSVAEQAAQKKHSIIFLPCHKSHVDYVSLQLIFYRLGIALPTVVAGDNLNFPVVGTFLQNAGMYVQVRLENPNIEPINTSHLNTDVSTGAMYIRRSFSDDGLYTTLVQAYMDTLLQKGLNVECFIEGGRSRTGKLLSPKFGILSFLLDSVLSGRVEDAIICPVSTQYDKVIETECVTPDEP